MRLDVGMLPDSAVRRAQLQAAAQTLGLALDDAVLDRLMAYLQLLQRWNQVYNLTALRDPGLMLSHHLVDCLAVLPALRRWAAAGEAATAAHDGADNGAGAERTASARALRILDVGSGGGLPGVVLAAAEPGWQVACVDTVAKKASFIRQVAAELRMPNLQGLHARVEHLQPPAAMALASGGDGRSSTAGYDLITSRAFASLPDFARLSSHLLAPGGAWMAMKGKPPDVEQAALPPGVEVFHVEHLQVPGLDAQRCLVWMRRKTT